MSQTSSSNVFWVGDVFGIKSLGIWPLRWLATEPLLIQGTITRAKNARKCKYESWICCMDSNVAV